MATDTSITALVRAHISAFDSGDVERAAVGGPITHVKVYREGSADPG